jgi:chemotaxis protein MotA
VAQKSAGARIDTATLLGLLVALAGIVGGLLLEGGRLHDIAQYTAAVIVFGGTLGAVLVSTPMRTFSSACKRLGSVITERAAPADALIDKLVAHATKARKNGIVTLEAEADSEPDPFLRKALNLGVDGTDIQEIRSMMQLQIDLEEQEVEADAKVWECAGGCSPTVGIIGAVMGLIQVMKNLSDIDKVGHGIAVSFVATVYGVGIANLLFLPAAAKIRARAQQATVLKELALEGVIGIVEGLNPKLIRAKLEAYAPGWESRARSSAAGSATEPRPGARPASGEAA